MSRKTSATPNFSLDPDLLRELNARYLHDINSTRTAPGTTNLPLDGNGLPAFLLPPFLRAEHYHQHTHTHEHNLNILTPSNNSLINGTINNSLIDKLSKSDNGLSPFLRTNNFSLPPPPPIFPPFNSANNNNNNNNNNSSTKELVSSPSSEKSDKWCAAHVRISWMIYHQQQRSKEKLSPSDNKKDEEQQKSSLNTKLPDLITNTKPLLPSATNDLPLQLPSTYQSPLLPPPAFNYRSPFDFAGFNNNGPFGRVPPSSSSSSSSTTAFGGLGSLFPSTPLPPRPPSSSLTIDRKPDMNGPVAAAAALGLDWSRFHRGLGPAPMIPPMPSLSSINENSSSKKLDDTSNSNYDNKKRSSSVLNNDDDRRSSSHLMLPPAHLANANYSSSSNRSRSRSPHPSVHHQHHHHSSNFLTKTSSSSPPSHSSSRKRHSPTIKSANISDTSKSSSSGLPSLPLPPTFGALDPLTLSMIERQRLSAAYASLFNAAANSSSNNFFPPNLDSPTFRPNGSPNLFPNLDSSAMTAALMQREHFLNSIRQQHEQINGRERAALASMSKTLKSSSKSEQITTDETPRISPKVSTSPGSHSSTSSSSRSSKKVKREKDSPSPPTENIETKLKESTSSA
ncbi:unnamed protein product [Adineta ricciae]|uniref:Uncharacterized protein n=1 Tax=Adineta ricciae TaxID=249248 RepID=A0A814UWS3_ADIRI|nr:unnamed protein product [Adineta ricciae]CAF1179500.1 unnamed protein product [Adineta ricciae]